MFYILGDFVMVVYQERAVYISKNAGHTITDFNWLKWLTLLSHGGLRETKKIRSALFVRCPHSKCASHWNDPNEDQWFQITQIIQHQRTNPNRERIHRFILCTMHVNVVRFEYVILDHWSWFGSSLRKTPLSETCTWSRACARDHLPRDNQQYFRKFVMF